MCKRNEIIARRLLMFLLRDRPIRERAAANWSSYLRNEYDQSLDAIREKVWRRVVAGWNWIWAIDRDTPVPFSTQKDGYSAFNALATFALAQGAALTIVARGEGRDKEVLAIYCIAVLFTVVWIWVTLNGKREETDADGHKTEVRAYDRPTVWYGRFTLGWTLILAVVMFYLATQELLPNQTPKVAYDRPGEECETLTYQTLITKTGKEEHLLYKWVEWASGAPIAKELKPRFIWLEQRTKFPKTYKPFLLDLTCHENYALGERVAFLMSWDEQLRKPTFRQVRFWNPGKFDASLDTLDVKDAREGDKIIVLLFGRRIDKSAVPDGKDLDLKLVPHVGGEAAK